MFQAKIRGWKRLAFGLMLLPGMAAVSPEIMARSTELVDQEMQAAPQESARRLMMQAREAYDKGDYAKAKALCEKAKTLPQNFQMGDDMPDLMLADIARKAPALFTKDKEKEKEKAAAIKKVTDPKLLLQMGRESLAAGKLDQAASYGQQAEVIKPSGNWGLFDDTPSSLLRDVAKAKEKRDQAESAKLLADAHVLFAKRNISDPERLANLEKASTMCMQAEKLHGPYSMWDFGERPAKLFSEIEAAKTKLKAAGVVAAKPGAAPAKTTSAGTTSPVTTASLKMDSTNKGPGPSTTPVSAEEMAKADANKHISLAKIHQKEGRYLEARLECLAAIKANINWKTGEENPAILLKAINAAALAKVNQLCSEAETCIASKTPADLSKAETHLNAANELAISFSFDTSIISEKKLALKVASASATAPVTSASTMPTPAMPAPAMPAPAMPAPAMPAPALPALAMPAPGITVDLKMPALTMTPEPAPTASPLPTATVTPTVTVSAPPSSTPEVSAPPMSLPTVNAPPMSTTPVAELRTDAGTELLNKAKLELRKGELETARKMTIEVLSGPYSGKAEAEALLRTIEAEDVAQHKLTSIRALESGITAYNNHEYARASAYFKQVDPSSLDAAKRVQLSDLMVSAQIAQSRSPDSANSRMTKTEVTQASGTSPVDQAPKPTTAASLLKQQEVQQALHYQMFRNEAMKVESDATTRFGKGETDVAMKELSDFIGKVKQSDLDPDQQKVIVRPLEVRMERLRLVKHNVDVEYKQNLNSNTLHAEMTKEALQQQYKHEKIAEMMKEYQKLYQAGKAPEAYQLALRMNELDPNDASVFAAMSLAKTQQRKQDYDNINKEKEQFFLEGMNDTDKTGPYVGGNSRAMALDPGSVEKMRQRVLNGGDGNLTISRNKSAVEKEIDAKLKQPISVNFKDNTLEQVVETFRVYSGLNIVIDTRALEEENLSPKMPINEVLNKLPMGSALRVILKKAHLAYKIEDDVLKITTEKHGHGSLIQKALPVADLVVRIANATPGPNSSINQAIQRSIDLSKPNFGGASTPSTPKFGLNGGEAISATMSNAGKIFNNKQSNDTWQMNGVSETAEKELMELIKKTIRPDSWEDLGGQGRLEFHAPTLALVVNQTPDIIEEITALLKSLRRLQDREVAIEVKMVTLSESFYERMGVDFSMDIRTRNVNIEPNLTSGINQNPPYINTLRTSGNIIGLQAPGVYTNNLDVPITSTSFAQAIPPFGGFQNNFSNGGLALGLSFLNNIQVSMFMEAAQGDRRINVMQAPKLTMFNGQSATMQVQDQQFFMTGITVTSANGQLTFTPNNNPFPLGVQMTIQPTISGDGTFVRLNINHQVTNLASTNVPLFPITTFITPVFEGGSQGQPIPFTQYVQQPSITSLLIQTTVAVPDGGTVLLGGMKTLSEGRNEYGPPVLGKIPYLDRLFRNTAYGRDAQSLLLMVTPRIIINREEQLRQTGTDTDNDTNPENQ